MVLLAWVITNLAGSWAQGVMLVMGAPRRGMNCFTSEPRCHVTCQHPNCDGVVLQVFVVGCDSQSTAQVCTSRPHSASCQYLKALQPARESQPVASGTGAPLSS